MPAPVVHHGDRIEGVDRCVQRRLADLGFLVLRFDLEHDQDRIADELQDLAAAHPRRSGAVFEVIVQQVQQVGHRQGFVQGREAAQVRIPEGGLDPVAVAALDLAVQDLFADARADERVEQAQRHPAGRQELGQRCEQVGEDVELLEIGVAEAGGRLGRQRQYVGHAGPEHQGQRVIVGHALGAQVVERRVVARPRRAVESPAIGLLVVAHELVRAADVGVEVLHAVLGSPGARALAAVPEHAPGQQLRVQRRGDQPHAVDRSAGGVQPRGQFVGERDRVLDPAAFGQQPRSHHLERPAFFGSEKTAPFHRTVPLMTLGATMLASAPCPASENPCFSRS